MIWQGYVLINKSSGITNDIKDVIINKAVGVDQSDIIVFRNSLNGDKSLVRCAFDVNGAELTTFLDSMDIDGYSIYGDLTYPVGDIIEKFKTSWNLAFDYMVSIIDEFQTPEVLE